MEYYIIKYGRQEGPYTVEGLQNAGITPETPVWRQGMTEWQAASRLPELASLFPMQEEESAFGSYARLGDIPPQNGSGSPYEHQNAYGQQSPYQQPNPYPQNQPNPYPQNPQKPVGGSSQPHTNWMPWAILGTVLGLCSCVGLICGVIGIIYASKANNAYLSGSYYDGDQANSTAKVMTIISLIMGVLGIIGTVIMWVFNLGSGFLSAVSNV